MKQLINIILKIGSALMIMAVFISSGCEQQMKKDVNADIEDYKKTMDRLIDEVWNDQNLDILPEVFTENAEMHLGGLEYNLKGIPNIRENYMLTTMSAFPDIHHGYDQLVIDGNIIAMMFYGEGTHKGKYDEIAATNKVLRYRGMAFFRMEENRIAEVWTHSNWAAQFAELTK